MSSLRKLFEEFPPVSAAEWLDKIKSDLKGADFEKLIWNTDSGFPVMPFYRREDIINLVHTGSVPGELPYIRGKKISGNSWKIRQDITVSDFSEANRKALDLLVRGVDSLGFYIPDQN